MIGQKQFAVAALDLDKGVFVIYIAYLGAKMLIYLAQKAQMFWLLAKKVIIILEYTDFLAVFFKKSIAVLLKYSNINKYAIDLKLNK